MKITVDQKEAAFSEVAVQVEQEDYMGAYNKEVNEQRKKASIKGFRPGKVPAGLIKKMLGPDFKMQVFNRVVSEELMNHLRESDTHYLYNPFYLGDLLTPEELEASKKTKLKYGLITVPESDIDLKAIEAETYKISVSDSDIQEEIEQLLKRNPVTVDVETVSDASESVQGTLVANTGEEEAKNHIIDLPLKNLPEESFKLFEGKKVGDEIKVDADSLFAEKKELGYLLGISEEEAQEISGEHTITIETISGKKDAELNQEFYDKVAGEGNVTDEESFKTFVKEQLEKAAGQTQKQVNEFKVQKALMDQYELEISDKHAKQAYEALVKEGDQETEDSAIDSFKKGLTWGAIQSKLLKRENIKFEEEDFNTYAREVVKRQFSTYGMPIQESMLDAFVKYNIEGENAREFSNEVVQFGLNDKLMTFLGENVGGEPKELDLKEMNKVVKELEDKEADQE